MKYRIPLWDKKDRVVFIEMEGTGHPQEVKKKREDFKCSDQPEPAGISPGYQNLGGLLGNIFPNSGQLY